MVEFMVGEISDYIRSRVFQRMCSRILLKALSITPVWQHGHINIIPYSILYKSQRPTFHLNECLLHLHNCVDFFIFNWVTEVKSLVA